MNKQIQTCFFFYVEKLEIPVLVISTKGSRNRRVQDQHRRQEVRIVLFKKKKKHQQHEYEYEYEYEAYNTIQKEATKARGI